ncbi:MAG TPA: metal-dependent hydrolase [Bacteroidetes bacterium]|nr:metal-dependent hydrolase [Bacteroidota bacterium]
MDSITQAALGAAIGEAMLGRKIGSKAAIVGAIIATIPDLDIALLPFYSAVDRISIHRGFSHSILFSLIGAFLFALVLLKMKWTKEINYSKLWLVSWLALITHVLLDAFTTYGTQLFLPFSNYRVSFDTINVVDPFYTVPLLIGLITSLSINRFKRSRTKPVLIGLALSTIYLIVTIGVKQKIENVFDANLAKQGVIYDDLLTVPVSVGSINWYGVGKTDESLFIGKFNVMHGNEIEFMEFPINDSLLSTIDHKLASTLKWFSKGYYAVAKRGDKIRLYNMQCDMQGVRTYGNYRVPTAFYFEVIPLDDGSYNLTTGMHKKQ